MSQTERPRILVIGATGQVGWELCRVMAVQGEVIPLSRSGAGVKYDLTDTQGLPRLLDQLAPDVICNAAAYTAVDQAESEPELAEKINAQLPAALAAWASGRDVPMLHYSTDYVFDGSLDRPYREDDTTSPLGVYGQTKLDGDKALLDADIPVWILRVSWVYGLRGNNFLRTMQRLMQERDSLRIVDDQYGAPTWSRSIAEASGALLAKLLADRQLLHTRGLYHLAPQGETSWYGFAEAIRHLGGYDCVLEPIPSREYPTPAARPANSRMNSEQLQQAFAVGLPDWREMLQACVGDAQ